MNALSDRTLARKIRELEPPDIETAYYHVIRLEASYPVLAKLDKILKTQEENFHSWRSTLEARLEFRKTH